MGLAGFSKNLGHRGARMRHPGRRKFAVSVTAAATLLACVLPLTLSAQTNVTPSTAQPVNRFLFIVETSRAMQPRAHGVFDAIKQALNSSLNGQIHQGDLVGIWTFNEVLYQELFPTQIWSQPTQLAFAVRLPTFADPELYQRRARLDKVVPEMLKVMAENENITIILVTTGDGAMEGPSFSAKINAAWKEWRDELEGIQMPLQTVVCARKGQPTDWSFTPAPRPIELPKLATAQKSGDEKKSNTAAVILESGLITNQPSSLGADQQVAFSVWALGKTGPVTSATSPQKISPQSKAENSAPTAVVSVTNIPNNQPSSTPDEPTKTAAVIPPKEEPNKSALAVTAAAEGRPSRIANDVQSVTPNTNTSPGDNGKPVELVFVTNAPVQPAPSVETAVKESVPAATPTPAADVPTPTPAQSQLADVSANLQPILAHARAADPSEEEKPGPVLATAPRGFLRENINPLVLMIVAGFGALYCFKMWLRANVRTKGNVFSLTKTQPNEQVGQEP
jgi:hypothetical protein